MNDRDILWMGNAIMDSLRYNILNAEFLYHVPASESWEHGNEVAIVRVGGWYFKVSLEGGELSTGHEVIIPDRMNDKGMFPGLTKWMITNNDAIEYGREE